MISRPQELECRTQCQGTPCLCIKADPVSATWTDPALPNTGGQYPNQGQYPGQGSLYPGQGSQGVQYPGQGVQYEGVDGQQHTYYPVSSRGQAGERVEARLPTYSSQWEANERFAAATFSNFIQSNATVQFYNSRPGSLLFSHVGPYPCHCPPFQESRRQINIHQLQEESADCEPGEHNLAPVLAEPIQCGEGGLQPPVLSQCPLQYLQVRAADH